MIIKIIFCLILIQNFLCSYLTPEFQKKGQPYANDLDLPYYFENSILVNSATWKPDYDTRNYDYNPQTAQSYDYGNYPNYSDFNKQNNYNIDYYQNFADRTYDLQPLENTLGAYNKTYNYINYNETTDWWNSYYTTDSYPYYGETTDWWKSYNTTDSYSYYGETTDWWNSYNTTNGYPYNGETTDWWKTYNTTNDYPYYGETTQWWKSYNTTDSYPYYGETTDWWNSYNTTNGYPYYGETTDWWKSYNTTDSYPYYGETTQWWKSYNTTDSYPYYGETTDWWKSYNTTDSYPYYGETTEWWKSYNTTDSYPYYGETTDLWNIYNTTYKTNSCTGVTCFNDGICFEGGNNYSCLCTNKFNLTILVEMKNETNCTDFLPSFCLAWKKLNKCNDKFDGENIGNICRKTCNKCSESNKNCQNKIGNAMCEMWKIKGKCSIVKTICAKTCNHC
ncbi:hypothetical protein SNEBB_003391 [Seison nebaliae]|nr:hypothetical protein SNEBB_003391 [Seison nebaliae]